MTTQQPLKTKKVTSNQNSIDYFSSKHPLRKIITKVAYNARQKMYNFLLGVIAFPAETQVLDVGVTPDQELADSNFFEKFYPYKEKITATSIEDASFLEEKYPGLRFVQTDGKSLPFANQAFDVVVSFAVLEHVGSLENQRQFVNEILRVGKFFFLTTPNRHFPIEVHTFLPFIHWLPQKWHQAILRKVGLKFWAQTENLNLLTPQNLLDLFPPNTKIYLHKHKLLGLSSNLIVYGTSPYSESQAK